MDMNAVLKLANKAFEPSCVLLSKGVKRGSWCIYLGGTEKENGESVELNVEEDSFEMACEAIIQEIHDWETGMLLEST